MLQNEWGTQKKEVPSEQDGGGSGGGGVLILEKTMRTLKFVYYIIMVAAPLIFRGDLKISDQNNWGEPEQKIKFGEELNLRQDLKFLEGL